MAVLVVACPTADEAKNPPLTKTTWQISHVLPASMQSSAWSAMSKGFDLGHNASRAPVAREIRWFQHQQDYIHELTRNAKPYLYYIYQQAEKRGMPAELALVPMVESDYKPFAYSRTGAAGLWQMMPGTASGFGIRINWWYDGRRDIIASTKAALDYFDYLHSYFGNWLLAIAAYDSGEGTVEMAIRHNQRLHRPTDFWSLPLPYETKLYIPKLLALVEIIRDPQRYHLHLDPVPNSTYFTPVDMESKISLNQVAELSDTPIKMIRDLNPGFRHWTTVSHQPYSLLLPKTKTDLFEQQLQTTHTTHTKNNYHRVLSGESLEYLAHHYHTTVATLKEENHLKNNTIRIGQTLVISSVVATKTKSSVPTHQKNRDKNKMITHVVHSGETLGNIAYHNHVSVKNIIEWNQLQHQKYLQPGQVLHLQISSKL